MKKPIISISLDERGLLHVQLVAATEMNFDINLEGLDYNRVLEDVCKLCPILIQMDVELAELYDGEVSCEPSAQRTADIATFIRKYSRALVNVEVGVDAFIEYLYA
jgi:sugar/nucleoside kinase (ribokinase family)